MNTSMTAGTNNRFQESSEPLILQHTSMIRLPARVISYIFHPVFIPVYVAWFLINIQPYLFISVPEWKKTNTMIQFLVMYAFFPLITTLLLKGLGFISSVYLKTQRDRIIPYTVCMIYYFWVWYVLYKQPVYPPAIVQFALAVFLASIWGLMGNIYMKISMHALALGVMLAFMIILGLNLNGNGGLYISVALLITGLVCTARFIDSDHRPREIYIGLLGGILCQLIASWLG